MIQPTPTYDAMAAALAPYSDDGIVSLPDAVRVAAGVAEALLAPAADAVAALGAQRDAMVADAAHAADVARSVAEASAAAMAELAAARADYIASLETAVSARGARAGALEALYVQARARWGHERLPEVMAAALAAVEEAP